jgi:repressor LexA
MRFAAPISLPKSDMLLHARWIDACTGQPRIYERRIDSDAPLLFRVSIRYTLKNSQELEHLSLAGGSDTMTANAQPPGDDDRKHALTERQQKILDCVHQSMESRGYPPTQREIAAAVGLKSTSGVSYQLKRLEEKGYLTRDAGLPRTVVEKSSRLQPAQERSEGVSSVSMGAESQNLVSMPWFERIAAGNPVIANLFSESFMQLPSEMVGYGELFAIRVAGDSMVNASIFDGDYVVVRRQDDAVKGDIVAALIEEEVTVKTFQHVDGHIWLMPQNPSYEPIPGDGCRLMGKVVATVHRV